MIFYSWLYVEMISIFLSNKNNNYSLYYKMNTTELEKISQLEKKLKTHTNEISKISWIVEIIPSYLNKPHFVIKNIHDNKKNLYGNRILYKKICGKMYRSS